jgi:hypothetical protein
METAAEIGIAAAIQLGTLIWFLSGMRSDVRHLTGWVSKIDSRQADADRTVSELKGQVESLPCSRCGYKLRA